MQIAEKPGQFQRRNNLKRSPDEVSRSRATMLHRDGTASNETGTISLAAVITGRSKSRRDLAARREKRTAEKRARRMPDEREARVREFVAD